VDAPLLHQSKKNTHNMKKITLVLLAAVAMFSFAEIAPSLWKSDKTHSNLKFAVTHLMVSEVEGAFKKFDIKVTSAKEDFSDAVVEFTGDIKSIDTENTQRDEHLMKEDFLDAAKYPTFTFKSKSFKKIAEKKYEVKGDLTLHGVTKEVTFEATHRGTVENPMLKKPVAGFKVSGTINRKDFGVGPTYASAMLSDEVTFTANAEFVKE
jgi:polyisoprenoid-binding protein YceI